MVTADKLENTFQCCGAWMNQGGALPLIIAIIRSSFFRSSLFLPFFETHQTITHHGLKFKSLRDSNSIFIIKDKPKSFPAAAIALKERNESFEELKTEWLKFGTACSIAFKDKPEYLKILNVDQPLRFRSKNDTEEPDEETAETNPPDQT